MKELRDILYTMELRYRERETDAEHEFQGIMDDLKNKVICIYRVKTLQIEDIPRGNFQAFWHAKC